MNKITSRVLRSLGFEHVDEHTGASSVDVDLSSAVKLASDGRVQVSLQSLVETEKFKQQVKVLGEIAQAHRDSARPR